MPISCHFRDCKTLLVTSLTHVSGAIASAQTFTFTFNVSFPCNRKINYYFMSPTQTRVHGGTIHGAVIATEQTNGVWWGLRYATKRTRWAVRSMASSPRRPVKWLFCIAVSWRFNDNFLAKAASSGRHDGRITLAEPFHIFQFPAGVRYGVPGGETAWGARGEGEVADRHRSNWDGCCGSVGGRAAVRPCGGAQRRGAQFSSQSVARRNMIFPSIRPPDNGTGQHSAGDRTTPRRPHGFRPAATGRHACK